MNEIEEAMELINKFIPTGNEWFNEDRTFEEAKYCALICIKEKMDLIEDMIQIDWSIREIFFLELEQIKIELEKL